MSWLFRPSILILLSVALTLGAAVLLLWQQTPEAAIMPLEEGDQEIVWLYAATSAANWERFVTAVNAAAQQLQADYPDLEAQITDQAFPPQTTTVPELALAVRGKSGRLVCRWYKLTSDQKTERWVERLVGGPRRPPLAIIGGASSDHAIELATALNRTTARCGDTAAPLLLVTTATAERIQKPQDPDPESLRPTENPEGRVANGPAPPHPQGPLLNQIYPQRSYRFCFTNRQMAEAVSAFIASQDALCPDPGPVYRVLWADDAYSRDLNERFAETLSGPAIEYLIGNSLGTFDQPNRWEARVVPLLMGNRLEKRAAQRRPLLVLSAASAQPARRFLRGLVRESPEEARRFVVATGDGLAFNTVYRDRSVAWPIQDLPFDLVFFCHRNPVDEKAGFQPEGMARSTPPPSPSRGSPSTGTEDLLLYVDMVKALVHAAYQGSGLPQTGDELRERLSQSRWKDGGVSAAQFDPGGQLLFDDNGNRRTGTGEHIVWLRPSIKGEQVLPRATIQVWSWPNRGPADTVLDVDYNVKVDAN